MNQIGQRIKQFRKQNGLTQEKLADYLGVTDKAVSKWECGLTAPDLALIMPLARVLGVSADELLGGKKEEVDTKRLEYDERYTNYLKYDTKENYQIALQAVKDYPNDYKYLAFLAQTEMFMAYCSEFKEEPTSEYSVEMLERAIKHNDMVIEDCDDASVRGNAIWNAMVCCKNMGDYDRAKVYAEMFPTQNQFTKDKAMELCLQGEELIQHKKMVCLQKTTGLVHRIFKNLSFCREKRSLRDSNA